MALDPRCRRLPTRAATRSCCGVLAGHHWHVPRRLAGFAEDRRRFNDLAALGHCQRVWDGRSPEWQADFYDDTTIPCRPTNGRWWISNRGTVSDPNEFSAAVARPLRARQQRSAAVHAPLALWNALLPVIGNRVKVTPSYFRAPWWGPMTCGGMPRPPLSSSGRGPRPDHHRSGRNIGVVAAARKLVTYVYDGCVTVRSGRWPKEPRERVLEPAGRMIAGGHDSHPTVVESSF